MQATLPSFPRVATSGRRHQGPGRHQLPRMSRARANGEAACLLEWARLPDAADACKIQVAESPWGRGLVATSACEPGTLLLEVPFEKLFKSNDQQFDHLHWAAGMAMSLLREQSAAASPWAPWIATLPSARELMTPLAFEDNEISALGDPGVISEVRLMQACIRACYECEELKGELVDLGVSWEIFRWATCIFTSRCFFETSLGCHLAVPGVDMANHSFQPTASVQIRHSVGYCQGRDAVEEVCAPPPPASTSGSSSVFQLIAGPEGIREGEDVTICYGAHWPNEAFLLLFGFSPSDNPGDAVVLFPSLLDLAQVLVAQLQGAAQGGEEAMLATILVQPAVAEALESGAFERLVVTRVGYEARMCEAFALVSAAVKASSLSAQPAEGVQQFVLSACCDRLATLRAAGVATSSITPAAVLATQFRLQKEDILESLLQDAGVTLG